MRRLDDFVPAQHPLRPIRAMVNRALKDMGFDTPSKVIGGEQDIRKRVWLLPFTFGYNSTLLQSVRILVKLATNNASKLAGDNASTCPLQKELQAES
jgi:uncharacterized lipoprotein YbaY